MDLPIVGHVPAEIAFRSPDPARLYYSNPDWAIDDDGLLLLWDTFGEDFAIALARRRDDAWQRVAEFDAAMHSHLIHLPDQGLTLVIGVHQRSHPRSIELYWSAGNDEWQGPFELFGGADFHAGSTPWAIHDGKLFVPFEIQATRLWGSYSYGAIVADLTSDLRRPASWTLVQNRVPWTVFPTCSHCGALEGNLVAAPDGQLYNLLRLPAYNRLGRARWNGVGWDWLGLVQGVHNQSKHELFKAADSDDWYLLANGHPARTSTGYRNTLCLWHATEPDLSRWRLLRVVASDRLPLHAFSYVAGIVDPTDDTLYIAERHGDNETHNYHDTNCTAVRTKEGFTAWVEEPALVPFGHDDVGDDGEWVKANSQDGLLLSHLDGALYPMALSATVRLAELPTDVGVLDLLGFATCDLVSIAAIQLVNEGRGAYLGLSTGGRRVSLRDQLAADAEIRLRLTLLSPTRCEAQLDLDNPVMARTHVASDPTLAGIIPRADRPTAKLGRVVVVERPSLSCGSTAVTTPTVPSPLVLTDGRGVTGPLEGNQAAPVENLAPSGVLLCGGHPGFFEPWAGGLMPGTNQAAMWGLLPQPPQAFSAGGFGRVLNSGVGWKVILQAVGERTPELSLRRDQPYLALLLASEKEGEAKLALAWRTPTDRQVAVASLPVGAWFAYAVTVEPQVPEGDAEPQVMVRVYGGEHAGELTEQIAVPVPASTIGAARHWLCLVGGEGNEVRGFGGVYLSGDTLTAEQVQAIAAAGFVLRLDEWPAKPATCAETAAAPTAPAPEAPAP